MRETARWILADRRHLLAPTVARPVVRDGVVRGASAAIVFAVSIPVAVVAPHVAPYIWGSFLLVRLILRRAGVLQSF